MLKQNKGKMLEQIPISRLSNGPYYLSRKFDGHYTQIIWDGTEVQFYTSGGKRFYIDGMAEWIKTTYKEHQFHIECEYIYGCLGKLGDRGKSAKLTTYRTTYNNYGETKGDPDKDTFIVLDRLDMPSDTFSVRLNSLIYLFEDVEEWFTLPAQQVVLLNEGIGKVKEFVKEGFEGGMLKHVNHFYKPGKRTNDIVKLKPRKTGDFWVAREIEGEGKYEGKIGSLELLDCNGYAMGYVGSGLTDSDRNRWGRFKHKVVEVEYERFDKALIQPTFKHLRSDKEISDCDDLKDLK